MKLTSIVNELIRLNSLNITILPQVSLCFWIAKWQSSKLNMSHACSSILKKSTFEIALHRENFFFIPKFFVWLVVAIHKDVSACWVPVEIAVEEQNTAFLRLFNHTFDTSIHRETLRICVCPLSIQIGAHKWASVIPYNHTVWVLHRYNLYHVFFSDKLRCFVVTYQEVDHALDHPGGLSFTRMDPRC